MRNERMGGGMDWPHQYGNTCSLFSCVPPRHPEPGEFAPMASVKYTISTTVPKVQVSTSVSGRCFARKIPDFLPQKCLLCQEFVKRWLQALSRSDSYKRTCVGVKN